MTFFGDMPGNLSSLESSAESFSQAPAAYGLDLHQPTKMLLSLRNFAVILAIFGLSANAQSATVPECAHWTTAFVFTEFMPHAEVAGTQEERLLLYQQNPQLCAEENLGRCTTRQYLITGDRVVIGHQCEAWAHVEFYASRKRIRTTGWVQLSRLKMLEPDQKMLAAQAKWSSPMKRGDTPLEKATTADSITEVKALVKTGAELNQALALAITRRKSGLAIALIELGAKPSEVSEPCLLTGNAIYGELRALSAILEAGAVINCTTGSQLSSPLKGLARADRAGRPRSKAMGLLDPGLDNPIEALKLLVRHGADLNIKDAWGGTPLRATVEHNNVDIATALLDMGADAINYIDDSTSMGEQTGNTILMHAVDWYSLRRDSSLVRQLLKHGADINFKNKLPYDSHCDKTTSGKCTFRGQTALTRAATDGYYPIVKLLLEHGANPALTRQDGATPAQIARENKHEDVANLIEEYIKK